MNGSLTVSKKVAKTGGKIAGDARKSIETQTGKSVITSDNTQQLNELVIGVIETVANDNKD